MKRILITAAALCLLPVLGLTQTSSGGGLTVITTPPGAEVTLDGEAALAGLSPITFSFPTLGEFRLKIRKHGYEDYKTTVLLDPAQPQEVLVELSPKTRFRAGLRSMLIPGWGQRYTGQKTKSLLFGVLFAGAAITLWDAENSFQDREDEYLKRLTEYDDAVARGGSIDDLSRRHDALASAQARAYDAENSRRLAIGVAVGVWGLNVIDALLSSPGERATFSVKGISVEPSSDGHSVGLTLSKAF